jgi:hypothetical protein
MKAAAAEEGSAVLRHWQVTVRMRVGIKFGDFLVLRDMLRFKFLHLANFIRKDF